MENTMMKYVITKAYSDETPPRPNVDAQPANRGETSFMKEIIRYE